MFPGTEVSKEVCDAAECTPSGAADPSLTDRICYIAFLACRELQLAHPQSEKQELVI